MPGHNLVFFSRGMFFFFFSAYTATDLKRRRAVRVDRPVHGVTAVTSKRKKWNNDKKSGRIIRRYEDEICGF